MNAPLDTAAYHFSKRTKHAKWTLHLNVLTIRCVTCNLLIWISRILVAAVTGKVAPSVSILLYFGGCKLAKFHHLMWQK